MSHVLLGRYDQAHPDVLNKCGAVCTSDSWHVTQAVGAPSCSLRELQNVDSPGQCSGLGWELPCQSCGRHWVSGVKG